MEKKTLTTTVETLLSDIEKADAEGRPYPYERLPAGKVDLEALRPLAIAAAGFGLVAAYPGDGYLYLAPAARRHEMRAAGWTEVST